MNTTNFQDTAQLFANSIATFLRQDEEFRAKWRYKNLQESLKIPRREALKNARAWADLTSEHLQAQETPDTLERWTGNMWQAWEAFLAARDAHMDKKAPETLKELKETEVNLKAQIRGVNALLAT